MNRNFMQEVIKQALNHPGEFNEMTLYPHDMSDIEKVYKCNKCGEQFILLLRTVRQGDAKCVPLWIICEKSGNKQLKEKMRVCYREKYISTFGDNNLKPDVENAIDHYDDYALQEMENKKCVMKDCDGTLDSCYDRDAIEEQENDDNKSNSTNDTEMSKN